MKKIGEKMTTQTWKIGDALELVADIDPKEIDLVLTNPPYPDYHTKIYKQTPIDFLNEFKCKQLVFWSAKVDFPLDYTAIHIWDKQLGIGTQYERIFERNGSTGYKVYNYHTINSSVSGEFCRETFYNHPSQKPLRFITKLILENTKPGDLVFDPFLGCGTILEACANTNRNCVGFEIDAQWEHLYPIRSHKHQRKLSEWV